MMKMHFNLEKSKQVIISHNINVFNKNMNYYICSSGGCGSTIIFNYLKNFGNVYHIHDRFPPNELCHIGADNTDNPVYSEWFNSTKIPTDNLNSYKVLFIYRHPIQVIFSRFAQAKGPNVPHLRNIKCDNDGNIWVGDVLKSRKDLYKLEEFFDNYTTPKERNYPIYCIKYEHFFANISLFNKALNIPDIPALYPTKIERSKNLTHVKQLNIIYHSLIQKMNSMQFIQIISPITNQESNEESNEESNKETNQVSSDI
jgi:hypothetical protein